MKSGMFDGVEEAIIAMLAVKLDVLRREQV
jgi:hypothetical protein